MMEKWMCAEKGNRYRKFSPVAWCLMCVYIVDIFFLFAMACTLTLPSNERPFCLSCDRIPCSLSRTTHTTLEHIRGCHTEYVLHKRRTQNGTLAQKNRVHRIKGPIDCVMKNEMNIIIEKKDDENCRETIECESVNAATQTHTQHK